MNTYSHLNYPQNTPARQTPAPCPQGTDARTPQNAPQNSRKVYYSFSAVPEESLFAFEGRIRSISFDTQTDDSGIPYRRARISLVSRLEDELTGKYFGTCFINEGHFVTFNVFYKYRLAEYIERNGDFAEGARILVCFSKYRTDSFGTNGNTYWSVTASGGKKRPFVVRKPDTPRPAASLPAEERAGTSGQMPFRNTSRADDLFTGYDDEDEGNPFAPAGF